MRSPAPVRHMPENFLDRGVGRGVGVGAAGQPDLPPKALLQLQLHEGVRKAKAEKGTAEDGERSQKGDRGGRKGWGERTAGG